MNLLADHQLYRQRKRYEGHPIESTGRVTVASEDSCASRASCGAMS
jgi:hypothetical protein